MESLWYCNSLGCAQFVKVSKLPNTAKSLGHKRPDTELFVVTVK